MPNENSPERHNASINCQHRRIFLYNRRKENKFHLLVVTLCFMLMGILFTFLFLIWRLSSAKVDDYAVVIDAGSTGSRCFVFHVTIDYNDNRDVTSASCGKVIPGLSTFIDNPDDATAYLAPLLHNAAKIIPAVHYLSTHVYIKATAGMRLLSKDVQHQLWEALVRGANHSPDIPFVISEDHIGTIDGHQEAFYAVLASNHIAGSIDGNLSPLPGKPLLGALDMGGSSTQLIFYNGSSVSRKVLADDFWSYSWLNYGVHKVQERVLDFIYNSANSTILKEKSDQQCFEGNEQANTQHPISVLRNPCGFLAHRLIWKNAVFEGTGEGKVCLQIIEKVIWPTVENISDVNGDCFRGRPCPIEEIEHPSVKGHHFYAMSVYFYALDCMRQLGPKKLLHWPQPTIEEVEQAALEFCGMLWSNLYEEYTDRNPHPYTRENQVSDRCFEILYIVTLLERGFGFDRHERSITFAQEVEGSEVEWTLGFALAEVEFVPHHNKIPIVAKNSLKYLLAKQSVTTFNVIGSFIRFGALSMRSYFRLLAQKILFYMNQN